MVGYNTTPPLILIKKNTHTNKHTQKIHTHTNKRLQSNKVTIYCGVTSDGDNSRPLTAIELHVDATAFQITPSIVTAMPLRRHCDGDPFTPSMTAFPIAPSIETAIHCAVNDGNSKIAPSIATALPLRRLLRRRFQLRR